MTRNQNKKMPAFQIGDKVRHFNYQYADTREVIWASKGKTRAEQLIVTSYDPLNSIEADIYVEAT